MFTLQIKNIWFIKTYLGRIDIVYITKHDFTIKTIRLCSIKLIAKYYYYKPKTNGNCSILTKLAY